jgi:hypothetical protein
MKCSQAIFAILLSAVASSAWATPCDALKEQIDAKIKTHNVKAYALVVVPAAEVKDQKVLGSCEAGSKKIVYKRE